MKISYFQNFKTIPYDFTLGGDYRNIIDFTPNFKVKSSLIDEHSLYDYYIIGNGERPDIVSYKIYGTTEYYWTFFVINEHLREGLRQWPLSDYELSEATYKKYGNYACITFHNANGSIDSVTSNNPKGDLSYVSITSEYSPVLYLQPIDEQGTPVSQYAKIVEYDHQSMQMIIEKTILDGDDYSILPSNTINSFVEYSSYKIIPINIYSENDPNYSDHQNLKTNWINIINNSYGNDDSIEYEYDVALLGEVPLAYADMQNATYMYYSKSYVDGVDDEIINTLDVISNYTDSTVARITYAEKEIIENEKKKSITIISPTNISKFSRDYFKTLNGV